MALDPLTVGLGDGPPGDDDEERAPGDDSPEVPLATSTAAAAAGSLAAVNAASANHESLVSGSSLAAILSANEAAGAKDGKEESEGNDGADDAGDDSVQAILARKRKLLLSMLDGAGSGNDEASPASKRMAAPASTDTSASSFSAIAGWEKQWTPEGNAIYINKKTGDKSETKPKGFDDLQRELAYNESGQYAKDQQAAATAAASGGTSLGAIGSGHYMDANNLGVGAVAPEPKAKWAPPNGMSFKEYKEYKKRLKMKRNGVF